MRSEGADARTPAPLALNATIDRRLAHLLFDLVLPCPCLGHTVMCVHASTSHEQ